jgi:hypothetical protein
MSGRKVADRPDPEWVATLKEGDRVAVAEWGREIYAGVVLRRTPKSDIIKTAPRSDCGLNETFHFYGSHRRQERIGRQPYGCRYLVPVASSPDSDIEVGR